MADEESWKGSSLFLRPLLGVTKRGVLVVIALVVEGSEDLMVDRVSRGPNAALAVARRSC